MPWATAGEELTMPPSRGERQTGPHVPSRSGHSALKATRRPFCWYLPWVPTNTTPFATAGDEANSPPTAVSFERQTGSQLAPFVAQPTANVYRRRPEPT